MRPIALAVALVLGGCGADECRICPDAAQDVYEGRPRCLCGGVGLVFDPADEATAECETQRRDWAEHWAPLYCH